MLYFPHPLIGDDEGLLAIGGDLSIERLQLAYSCGIFPWYNEEPILWWYTHPRCILYPKDIKIRKSMRQTLRRNEWKVTCNQAFVEVITCCAQIPRPGQAGTWLTYEMKSAYVALHEEGIAHSFEVWEGEELIGGLYGVVTGNIFCGESMFAKQSDASKVALIHLARYLDHLGCTLIDCQQDTPHIRSMGAVMISGEAYWEILRNNRLRDALSLSDHTFREYLVGR